MRALSRSEVRGEADRTQATLLTLQGWTSLEGGRGVRGNAGGGSALAGVVC
ncbi:MAG: hypothetical protein ACRYHQ_14790 [Janthinobacterium lividum]